MEEGAACSLATGWGRLLEGDPAPVVRLPECPLPQEWLRERDLDQILRPPLEDV